VREVKERVLGTRLGVGVSCAVVAAVAVVALPPLLVVGCVGGCCCPGRLVVWMRSAWSWWSRECGPSSPSPIGRALTVRREVRWKAFVEVGLGTTHSSANIVDARRGWSWIVGKDVGIVPWKLELSPSPCLGF